MNNKIKRKEIINRGKGDEFDNDEFWSAVKEVRAINDEYYKRTGKRKKSLTVTYGCQMNVVRPILKLHKKGHRPIYI